MDNIERNMKSTKSDWLDWLRALLLVAILFFAYRFFQNIGWLKTFDIQSQNLTLGVSFVVGFVASLSSCLAVVGSMVIAFGEKYHPESQNFMSGVIRPNFLFHAGRIATFFVLGGLLGAVGGTINLSGSFVSVYMILIAVVMGWLGLNILGIMPSISTLGLRSPKVITKLWARAERSEHAAAPFLLGGITFFLPCGFTQSMQVLALASGSFWRGAAILSIFSIGTAPVLFLLGVSASWGRTRNLAFIQKAAGILILFFAVFTLQSGLALHDVKTNIFSGEMRKIDNQINQDRDNVQGENYQTVEMHVTSQGFEPSVLRVKAGIPVHWVVKGDQVSGCTNQIIVPSYQISKRISSGENIINFTPEQKGDIRFSCGMGMVRGKFIVQ